MRPFEHYLSQYDESLKNLTEKGELWRLRNTREEFIEELKKIEARETQMIQAECFNSYHIQTTIESEVGLLLQNNMTQEEIKEQFRRNKEITDKMFAEDAPRVKEQISKLSPPLDLNKTKKICAALFRKQITEDDIPQELYPELIQTRNYIHISKRIKSFQDNKTE